MGSRALSRSMVVVLAVLLSVGMAAAALPDCTNTYNTLTTCYTWLTAPSGASPPGDCCKPLGTVQKDQPVCLCELLSQFNGSAVQGINTTLALELPSKCGVAADTTKCPGLLGVPTAAPATPTPATASPTVASGPSSSTTASGPSSTIASGPPSSDASTFFPNRLVLLGAGAFVGLKAISRLL